MEVRQKANVDLNFSLFLYKRGLTLMVSEICLFLYHPIFFWGKGESKFYFISVINTFIFLSYIIHIKVPRAFPSYVRSSMSRGGEIRPLLVDVGLKFERAEMQMIRWMCGIFMKDRRTNEELRRLVGVEPITTGIRSGRLRWYGHVMRGCKDLGLLEKELTQKERTTLAQLRSEHCRLLGSYKSRIGKDVSLGVCADCGKTLHNVKHLFNCPAHPTTMTLADLWNRTGLWMQSGNSAISRQEY